MLAYLWHPVQFQRLSRLGSVTARHSSSGRQPNFAVLNRGRHLYSAGWPSRWALAHILVWTLLHLELFRTFSNFKLISPNFTTMVPANGRDCRTGWPREIEATTAHVFKRLNHSAWLLAQLNAVVHVFSTSARSIFIKSITQRGAKIMKMVKHCEDVNSRT